MGTGSFPGVKSGRGVTLTTHPISCRGHERVELYTSTPLWVVWHVQSLRACTRVLLTFTTKGIIFYRYWTWKSTQTVIRQRRSDITSTEDIINYHFFGAAPPSQWAMASSFMRFLDHTQRRTTIGRTPLDEWSARRRDLYLTTHNTHNRQTSIPPVRFELRISAGERLQTYILNRTAAGIGNKLPQVRHN